MQEIQRYQIYTAYIVLNTQFGSILAGILNYMTIADTNAMSLANYTHQKLNKYCLAYGNVVGSGCNNLKNIRI